MTDGTCALFVNSSTEVCPAREARLRLDLSRERLQRPDPTRYPAYRWPTRDTRPSTLH